MLITLLVSDFLGGDFFRNGDGSPFKHHSVILRKEQKD